MTNSASVSVVPGSGVEPGRLSVAFVLATVVTMAAVVPLGALAWQARNDEPALSTGLTVNVAGAIGELNGFVLERGADAELSVDDPDIVAMAWSLYAVGSDVLHQGETVGSPPLSVSLPQGTLAALQPGFYDLLVSGTTREGALTERAARFQVAAS